MSIFNIDVAQDEARRRLGGRRSSRRKRSDAGRFRMAPRLAARLSELLGGDARPPMATVLRDLEELAGGAGLTAPSRATIYQFMRKTRTPERRVGHLPSAVRAALYNLDDESLVPEAQIAFYCFNYGTPRAIAYAAGLPWLALYQALRTPGWRRRSHGLIRAACKARGI